MSRWAGLVARRGRLIRGAAALVVALTIGVLVVPVGTWFDTQANIADAQAQLTELRRENADIQSRVDDLSDRDNIERQAVVDFGMAHPGDEIYAITPSGPIDVDLPDVWPFNRLQAPLRDAAR